MMTASSTSVSAVWMLLCSLALPVVSSPLCTGPVCPVASLANLFDRVIQHSARMHAISTSLHQDFEQQVAPSRNHIGRVNRNCHTSSILTPNDKENAQRMTREELTEVILKLLVAWREPLWHFEQRLRPQSLETSDRAAQVGRMVHEVRSGVQRVAQKMQMLGMIGNFVSGLSSPEAQAPSESSEWQLLQNWDLLHCLRRDANKVQNYLKILKCRIVPEYGC
ncbi:prolactin 2 [Periophthalmus magnuspinnatus]|uniref:prolactin 2 n=1 Tax=Periophthalmus magnuspinnatus TaxID=409849 RepID=UPI002436EC0D|nr:prolactin 2 [Periophthalmus magnuspinnatus]